MRLPGDAALLITDDPRAADATAALLQVWREEALPLFHIAGAHDPDAIAGEAWIVARADSAFADTDLEARLDAIGATTLVFADGFVRERLQATVLAATERGYRVFVVGGAAATDLGGDVRVVSDETAIEAARRAKFRQRWAVARRGG